VSSSPPHDFLLLSVENFPAASKIYNFVKGT